MTWEPYQEFTYLRTYSRWIDELERRETYPETSERFLKFIKKNLGITDLYLNRARHALLGFESMPSMRALWAAGSAAEQNNIALYNCAYLTVSSVRAFAETLYILMCGTGVGFSVERQYVEQLPQLQPRNPKADCTVVVEDSKEGWAKAFAKVLDCLWCGGEPTIDYSKVRPRGARLKTMGGRASGPEPLADLFEFCRRIIREKRAKGHTRLQPVDCLDIENKVAEIVVVGGVRRSSEICLSDLEDRAVAEAKMGEFWQKYPHRSMSNNSAVYLERPEVTTFLEEFVTLIKSQAGERGIFNRAGAMKQMLASGRRVPWIHIGTNPCVAGDTVIATLDGPKTFRELAEVGEDVQVYAWNPKTKVPVVRTMRNPRKTRENAPILELEFDSGLKLRCTPDHNLYTFRGDKVEAQNLKVGQSIRAFSMSRHRDGHLRVHGWDNDSNKAAHQWVARMVYEAAYGSVPDGKVVHHIDGNKENNHPSNLEAITPLEHNQEHYIDRLMNGFHHPSSSVEHYMETIGVQNHKLLSVRLAGYEDVYNGTVDDVHTYIILDPTPVAGIMSGVVSANCGEIILRDMEFCNLSEVVVRASDTLESLKKKVKTAAMFGAWQSTFTNFPYLRSDWKKNCEEERLLGVSLTGIMDNAVLNSVNDTAKKWLAELKAEALRETEKWSKRLGVNMSAAVTCVKPSGTVSQLVNCASGIHQRYSDFYLRRYRISATDPLFRLMRDQGVPCSPEVGQDPSSASTYVLSFPVASPIGSKTRHDYTALDQLNHWKMVKEFWTEHNPSITVYVGDDEWLKVGSWVYDNFDSVCGISFLPRTDHVYQLAPYEEITRDQYEQVAADFPQIDYSKLSDYEKEDNTSGSKSYACVGDRCELA